jgi:hypothetical protein
VMHLAVSAEVEGRTGLYYDGLEPSRPERQAFDREARRQLAALTEQLIGGSTVQA